MAHVSGVFHDSLTKSISDSKILMVGAGGIGCELLKNIVLTGLVFMCFLFVIRILVDVQGGGKGVFTSLKLFNPSIYP